MSGRIQFVLGNCHLLFTTTQKNQTIFVGQTRYIEKAALCHCLVTIIVHRVLLWCAALRRILVQLLVGTPFLQYISGGTPGSITPNRARRREWRRRRRRRRRHRRRTAPAPKLEKKWEQTRTESCLYLFMEQQSALSSR